MFVLVVVLLLSSLVGIVAAAVVRRWPQADPALSATRAIGDRLGRRWQVQRFLRSRLDPGVATGLALTTALIGFVVAGAIIGVLTYMVRTNSGVVNVDSSVARWAAAHVSGVSIHPLRFLTQMGATPTIIALAAAGAALGLWRSRSVSVPLFLTLVVGGQLLISNLIKFAVDRARPDVRPLSTFSGASFPSGHATAAAATFAALALLVGRGRSPNARAILAGISVSIAVGVACSRVLLGVHWFSDVVAALMLGWAWFAICAVAFGGRLLLVGAAAKAAATAPILPKSAPDCRD